jgi:hypothetical protein
MSQATYVGQRGAAVVLDTPHDKTNGYHVGVAGDILITQLGVDVLYKGIQAGQFVPYSGTCCKTTAGGATNIVAIY